MQANLVGSLCHGDGTANIGGTPTINHSVVDNKISDGAYSIMQCPLCFVHDLKTNG